LNYSLDLPMVKGRNTISELH